MMSTYETGYTGTDREALGDLLEGLVDRFGLPTVIDALGDVCLSKGEHLRVNWQDAASAGHWESHGRSLQRMAVRITKP